MELKSGWVTGFKSIDQHIIIIINDYIEWK